MSAPLLNDYKWKFAKHRYLSTLLGGIRAPPTSANFWVQILVWFISFLILSAPIVILMIVNWICSQNTCSSLPLGVVYGMVMMIISVCVRVGVNVSNKGTGAQISEMPGEDHIDRISNLNEIIAFIFPSRFGALKIIFQSIMMSTFLGVVCNIFQLEYFLSRYSSPALSIALFWMTWISISLANYSLFGSPPVDMNTYHTFDAWDIDIYSRPFHILFVSAIWYIEIYGRVDSFSMISFSQVAGYIMALLPCFWSLGILPSIRIAFMYIFEAANCLIGGSPSITWSTDLFRLVSCCIIVISIWLQTNYSEPTSFGWLYTAVLAGSICGSQLLCFQIWTTSLEKTARTDASVAIKDPLKSGYILFRLLILAGITYYSTRPDTTRSHVSTFILLGVLLARKMSRECLQILIPSICPIIHVFTGRNNHETFLFRVSSIIYGLCYHLLSLLSILRVLLITVDAYDITTLSLSYRSIWSTSMLFRSFYWPWTFPEGAATDVLLVELVNYILIMTNVNEPTQSGAIVIRAWRNADIARHSSYWWLIAPILIISPITIIISSILNMPSMTLLGLPLLIPTFWRPKRMIQSLYEKYEDRESGMLYSALMPSFTKAISKAMRQGQLPPLEPGELYLARSHSMLMFIYGIEKSFESLSAIITGLEVEPTSCHALEGVELDKVLEDSLTRSKSCFGCLKMNPHFNHILVPLGAVVCQGYVESKQSTVGILDNPVILKRVPTTFAKVLIFNLMHAKIPGDELHKWKESVPLAQDMISGFEKFIPSDWIDIVGMRSYTDSISRQSLPALVSCWIAGLLSLTPYQLQTNVSSTISPTTLYGACRGDIPIGVNIKLRQWLLSQDQKKLRVLAMMSMRQAIRLVYEEAVEGDVLTLNQLQSRIQILNNDWLITIDPSFSVSNDPTCPPQAIYEAFKQKRPNIMLFTKKDGQSSISIRMYEYNSNNTVLIGRLNGDAVRSIWSNLAFELLYLTNDDDERYSIQVHELLLRNITVQAAPPPFGYPIWVSPVTFSLLPEWMTQDKWNERRHSRHKRVYDEEFAADAPSKFHVSVAGPQTNRRRIFPESNI